MVHLGRSTCHTISGRGDESPRLDLEEEREAVARRTLTPYTLHPTPYTLHPTPYTLQTTLYTLHTPYTLHLTPYTMKTWSKRERRWPVGPSTLKNRHPLCGPSPSMLKDEEEMSHRPSGYQPHVGEDLSDFTQLRASGHPETADSGTGREYRVTSLIRDCPPPQGHRRALGMVLL